MYLLHILCYVYYVFFYCCCTIKLYINLLGNCSTSPKLEGWEWKCLCLLGPVKTESVWVCVYVSAWLDVILVLKIKERTVYPSLLFKKWFSKQYWCRFLSFCHICFHFNVKKKSAVLYANVLFFKKCYCTVNIIVNIFVSSW